MISDPGKEHETNKPPTMINRRTWESQKEVPIHFQVLDKNPLSGSLFQQCRDSR